MRPTRTDRRGTAEMAIKWCIQEYADDPDTAVAFLIAWWHRTVERDPEWAEYRYWITPTPQGVSMQKRKRP